MAKKQVPNVTEERAKADTKRTRISQADVPGNSLEAALRVPKALIENYAGGPATPLQLASALKMAPSSGPFRSLCGSSIAYGLTAGGYNASEILVEPLAKRILSPLQEGDDKMAKKEASLRPRVLGEFIKKYQNSPLPRHDIALNVLAEMGVPKVRAESVYTLILDTAELVGFIREIKGKQYIDLSGVLAEVAKDTNTDNVADIQAPLDIGAQEEVSAIPGGDVLPITTEKHLGKGIFIAHGKKKRPLEQLKNILDQFKVPYKVAIDEPNLGRPIGHKIKEIMESCNCAILIFTADEEFFSKDGDSIWRPSENVIYELGASGYLYENRIVILKEESVVFPSNFKDLGYISFANDQLEAKTMDVLKELIGFSIVKIST